MTDMPEPPKQGNKTDDEAIKLGIVNVPKNQLFPIVLILVLLSSGAGMVLVTTDEFRLAGLIAIIVGLGWAAFIYQNIQNRRLADQHDAVRSARQEFDLTITVLSPDDWPVQGALVTVRGPVPFTNKKTNKNGRIVYKYTGRDADHFRNRDITITAVHEDMTATVTEKLRAQTGQFIDLKLLPSTPPTAPTQPILKGASPIMGMNADTYQRIVDFVAPHVNNHGARQALLNRAFFGTNIVQQISTSGASSVFAAHLITELHRLGGIDAVITLLETLKRDLGSNRQHEIDALIAEIRTEEA